MNIHKFARTLMGKRVLVERHLERSKSYGGRVERKLVKLASPCEGWVVGRRSVKNGLHVPGGYEDPGYLKDVKGVPVVLVAFWPDRRPVPVPLDGFALIDQSKPVGAWGVSEKDREAARKDYQKQIDMYPRGKHGRFVPFVFKPKEAK